MVNLFHRKREGPIRSFSKKKKMMSPMQVIMWTYSHKRYKNNKKKLLQLYDTCSQLLDPDDKMKRMPFD
jgi:hypothetical protein